MKNIIDVYDSKAKDFFDKFISCETDTGNIFNEIFFRDEKILDIGTGSGRDMKKLEKLGVDIYGTEPSKGLRELLKDRFPEYKNKIFPFALPFKTDQFRNRFHGVLLSAVLFHIPEEKLEESIESLRSILFKKGKVVLSISEGERGLDDRSMDKYGRYFSKVSADKYIDIFQKKGFLLKRQWIQKDSMGRNDINWKVLFFVMGETDNDNGGN